MHGPGLGRIPRQFRKNVYSRLRSSLKRKGKKKRKEGRDRNRGGRAQREKEGGGSKGGMREEGRILSKTREFGLSFIMSPDTSQSCNELLLITEMMYFYKRLLKYFNLGTKEQHCIGLERGIKGCDRLPCSQK